MRLTTKFSEMKADGKYPKELGKKLLHYKSGTQVPLFSYNDSFEMLR